VFVDAVLDGRRNWWFFNSNGFSEFNEQSNAERVEEGKDEGSF
jgi:hypothetical protein